MFQKIKLHENDIIIAIVIVLVALIGFGFGRLSAIEDQKTPVIIEDMPASVGLTQDENKKEQASLNSAEEELYVASKNSNKYHFPWCSGALRIKEENKIWFASREEAEKAGYTPAANCKGL